MTDAVQSRANRRQDAGGEEADDMIDDDERTAAIEGFGSARADAVDEFGFDDDEFQFDTSFDDDDVDDTDDDIGSRRSNGRPQHDSSWRFTVPDQLVTSLRAVLDRHEFTTGEELPRVIAVVSSIRGEGVTTVSRALASILAADRDASVTWVDLSWSHDGSSHNQIATTVSSGITDVLDGIATVPDVISSDPDQPGVQLVHSGDLRRLDRSRLARKNALGGTIEELSERFDFVVLDTPPLLEINSEALTVLHHAQSQLLVVQHGATSVRQVRSATNELRSIPSLGVILNQYRTRTPRFIRRRLPE